MAIKMQKEVNLIQQKVKFTFELTLEDAKVYMKALKDYKIPDSLELIPDDILSFLIEYKLRKYHDKKEQI